MQITLYNNKSDPKKIGKDLTIISSKTDCKLKDTCSMLDPQLLMKRTSENLLANYAYIKEFNRFYFIKSKTVLTNGLIEIDCHVDVLESYKQYLYNMEFYISRQEALYNKYLLDDKVLALNKQMYEVKSFGSGFSPDTSSSGTPCFVLVTAGG